MEARLLSEDQKDDKQIQMKRLHSTNGEEERPHMSTSRLSISTSMDSTDQHSDEFSISINEMIHMATARDAGVENNSHETCCALLCHSCRKNKFKNKRMSPLQELILTPYEKLSGFGIIPVKAILHVFVCILATNVVIWHQQVDAKYYRRVSQTLCRDVMPDDIECLYHEHATGVPIYTVEEFLETYSGAIDGFSRHTRGRKRVDRSYPVTSDTHLKLEWSSIANFSHQQSGYPGSFTYEVRTETANVSSSNLFPLFVNSANMSDVLYRTRKIVLTGEFRNFMMEWNLGMCRQFEMRMVWDFTSRGFMILTLDVNLISECYPSEEQERLLFNIFIVLLLMLNAILFMLIVRSILRRVAILSSMKLSSLDDGTVEINYVKKRPSCSCCKGNLSGNSINLYVPMHFWTMLVGTACMIYTSAKAVSDHMLMLQTNSTDATIWALGILLLWLEVRRYLNYNVDAETFLLFKVLDKAAPKVLTFMFSCVPVILAYTVAGIVLFSSREELFRDLLTSFVTLFCLSNGDAMIDVFDQVYEARGWLGEIYLITWCMVVIYVIVNVFLVIIQRSYEEISLRHGHGHSDEAVGLVKAHHAEQKMTEDYTPLNEPNLSLQTKPTKKPITEAHKLNDLRKLVNKVMMHIAERDK